jgi:hypothetical protein
MKKWAKRGFKTAGILGLLLTIGDLYDYCRKLDQAMEEMHQEFGSHTHVGDGSIVSGGEQNAGC